MLQESLKSRLETISAFRKKIEAQVRPQLDSATAELNKVLRDMGADTSNGTGLTDVVSQIHQKNPSLRQLALRFDIATYDVRKKLWWNAHMMSAYVTDRAEQAYTLEMKPTLAHYRASTESRAKSFIDQLRDLRTTSVTSAKRAN